LYAQLVLSCREINSIAKKDTSEVTKVIEGTTRFIPFQDFANIDWTMEEFQPRVAKTNPGVFALLGNNSEYDPSYFKLS